MLRVRRSWVVPALTSSVALVLVSAGAAAALETDTVRSYGRGLLWSMSLMTTVGFIGAPPKTLPGALLSVLLMVAGFVLLALVSAALASLFVREDERPVETEEERLLGELRDELVALRAQLAEMRAQLGDRGHASG